MAAPAPLKAKVHDVTGEILEDEVLKAAGLAQLRAAIVEAQKNKDTAFPVVREDDLFLLAFLRARKYEIPRALLVLRTFSRFWHNNPTLINGLSSSVIRRVYELGFMRQLETKDVHGNQVRRARAHHHHPPYHPLQWQKWWMK